ncbi:MAG: hypothetical protein PWR24_1155 [Desulfonauticus sp.]|jgi:putative FmdB family regulatory protein|nr:hypothetical protein [Desulfonauticus sp.]
MPIYEYQCQQCGQVFEEWQSNYEEKELSCPVCNGVSKRLISNTSFILKGSGWYVTDYSRGSSNGSRTSTSSSASKTSTSSTSSGCSTSSGGSNKG